MVTTRDIYGQTALHHAVMNKNLLVLSQLAAKGIDLDAIDENGNTALHLAAQDCENLTIVKTLLELGAVHTIKNDSGLTPIDIAEIESQVEKSEEKSTKFTAIVKTLQKPMQKKIQNAGVVLMKSTELGDVVKFQAALFSGGSITAVNIKGENVIHRAAWYGRVNIFRSLLENDTNKAHIENLLNAQDKAGCTPVHNAVIRSQYDMVDALIDSGAELNTTDKLGMTPLMEAAFWDKIDILELILMAKPEMHHKDIQGRDAIELARQRKSRRSYVALKAYRI